MSTTRIPKVKMILEYLSIPLFIYLIYHLSSHAFIELSALINNDHHHHHDCSSCHQVNELTWHHLWSVLFTVFSVILWNCKPLKKWVPCRHSHCHREQATMHILASVAFCAHFFPEAFTRAQLLDNSLGNNGEAIKWVALIAFFAHFCVDIIIAWQISFYWQKKRTKIISLIAMFAVWLVAFWLAEKYNTAMLQGQTTLKLIMFFVGAFLLGMFVHKPHHRR